MKKCKECYHFRPLEVGMQGDIFYVAECKHPICYNLVKYQTAEGKVKEKKKRIQDILELNPDGNCTYWEAFHFVKIKKRWWIFEWTSEKKVLGKEE